MINWRAWLTEQLVGSWMENGRHYRLLFSAGEHDNPDQRIAEDIHIATESAIALTHSLVYSLMTMGLFIEILWSVSGAIVVPSTGGFRCRAIWCRWLSFTQPWAARSAGIDRPTAGARNKRPAVRGGNVSLRLVTVAGELGSDCVHAGRTNGARRLLVAIWPDHP